MEPVHYSLFLTLSVAVRILSTEDLFKRLNTYAESLLKYFVNNFGRVYGDEHLSYNVHGLLHLAADAKHLGPLDTFSAFRFENHLGQIKKSIRCSRNPLQQLHRRIYESNAAQIPRQTLTAVTPRFEHHEGPLPITCCEPQFKEISFPNFKLNCRKACECVCLLKNSNIVTIENICTTNAKNLVLIGRKYLSRQMLFKKPCDSSMLDIYKVNKRLTGPLECFSLDTIAAKCITIPDFEDDNCLCVFPLLHSID